MLIPVETPFKPYCYNQLCLTETHFKRIAITGAPETLLKQQLCTYAPLGIHDYSLS